MPLVVDISKSLEHFVLKTDFSCRPGTLTAVVGPSGAGKTTLVRLIAGLETADRGRITLGDTVWTDTEQGRLLPTRKRNIGLVFQDYALFPHLTIRRNIAFGAENPASVDRLMSVFGISHLQDKKPAAVSGGERQRAAFCQALASEPDLLLLDEPFSALDVATRSFLCSLLERLKQELAIPILHVTHDLDEARRLGDAVIALERGRIAPDWLGRQCGAGRRLAPTCNPY